MADAVAAEIAVDVMTLSEVVWAGTGLGWGGVSPSRSRILDLGLVSPC